jgi:orotidine-5'-phosphate decarboxylase
MTFGKKLAAALGERGPLCVGIDPHSELLLSWGLTDDVDGLSRFAEICVQALAGEVAVLKPQSAFFERFGAAGVGVLENTIRTARAAGAIVLLDVKRGDIGSTMAAYAQAYLAPTAPMAADAMTVSPYLGVGSLQPAFDVAAATDAGVFVLALTSNPEGPQVQHATGPDGCSVAQQIVDDVASINVGADPFGSIGLVVGATIGDAVVDFAQLNGPVLVPGIGAQGGTAADVARIFAGNLAGVLPSVSREVLRAGPDPAALRSAALAQIDQFEFLRA